MTEQSSGEGKGANKDGEKPISLMNLMTCILRFKCLVTGLFGKWLDFFLLLLHYFRLKMKNLLIFLLILLLSRRSLLLLWYSGHSLLLWSAAITLKRWSLQSIRIVIFVKYMFSFCDLTMLFFWAFLSSGFPTSFCSSFPASPTPNKMKKKKKKKN